MRKALVVGINYYERLNPLYGCVDDAHAVKAVLETNADGSANFGVRLLTGTGPAHTIARSQLKDSIAELFSSDDDIALLYFAGHGHIESVGGYLLSSDASRGDEGVSLAEVCTLANQSMARNKIIVLDSCHAGIAGTAPVSQMAELTEGTTILTASTKDQYATEDRDGGVFTRLFVDALSGSAANLVGEVTPGSVYAHVDKSLGQWSQRPVFKTNVKSFVCLRKVQPPIDLADLRRLTELFPQRGHQFALDPTFEPEMRGREPGMSAPDPENTRKFAVLQKYNRVGLLVPVDAAHMWNAAMESKACRLTGLGEHYRRLVENKRI